MTFERIIKVVQKLVRLLKSKMRRGGRPSHSYWQEGGFVKKVNEKGVTIAAICTVPGCKNKILSNTAINRLKAHRLVLKMNSINSKVLIIPLFCLALYNYETCLSRPRLFFRQFLA